METNISSEDLLELLLGHAQWAMNEATFASYISVEMIKKHRNKLNIQQQDKLVKLLRNYLNNNCPKQNIQIWQDLISNWKKFPL